jgi:hypothetical protein
MQLSIYHFFYASQRLVSLSILLELSLVALDTALLMRY